MRAIAERLHHTSARYQSNVKSKEPANEPRSLPMRLQGIAERIGNYFRRKPKLQPNNLFQKHDLETTRVPGNYLSCLGESDQSLNLIAQVSASSTDVAANQGVVKATLTDGHAGTGTYCVSGCISATEASPATPVAVQLPQKLLVYPVLPLQDTLERYLCSIQPFFKRKAFVREQALTLEFLHKRGKKLQALLEAAAVKEKNWLTERWTKATFLRYRAPLPVFSSPCMAFPPREFLHSVEYADFTAKVIYGMCEVKQMIDRNQLPVQRMDHYELDNSQFRNVFGTVRIPRQECDLLEQCNSNYVVVIHKNHFYRLPVYNRLGLILDVRQLRQQLLDILECNCHKGPAIGLLTQDTRCNWAEAHEILERYPCNCEVIHRIERSLFTVCLDEFVPARRGMFRTVQAEQLLYGGGHNVNSANRWMDKTLQLIVNPNGMAGICYEHAPADCQPVAMIIDYVEKKLCDPEYGYDCNAFDISDYAEPLYFEPIGDCVDLWLSTAQRNMDKISERIKLHVFKFEDYGRCLIQSQGISPDSYLQMALQLAYFRLHKELPAQLESAHLRIFRCGRTEGIRSTSNQSLCFLRAMTSTDYSLQNRFNALRCAADTHQMQTKQALRGRAIDRHLFGLRQMAREHGQPMPQFFCSEGYVRSSDYRIASSQVSTPHDAFMAFGPFSSSGYGCSYNPREHDVIFALSAWQLKPHINVEDYGRAIDTALMDMKQLMLDVGGPCAAQAASACVKTSDNSCKK
ncbi:carnitine O-acetyltransferase-like [Drosophila busckii]|uniref:carnitine O-acetyltransferase-like n=1 Tax=Drosophila busckii TaxID=30019 RepID=UPI0014333BCC|nr:carnitine O-acetyltransferase-like [Drosophila busckii]